MKNYVKVKLYYQDMPGDISDAVKKVMANLHPLSKKERKEREEYIDNVLSDEVSKTFYKTFIKIADSIDLLDKKVFEEFC